MLIKALLPTAGVFAIGLLIGLIVLMSAEETLTTVARAGARDISGSFWLGVLWQALAAPLLLVLVLGCAVTIIGILAIPVAVLAWALAYIGAFTLGLLAVALVVGRAIAGRGAGSNPRAVALRGLAVGLTALSSMWFAAALLEGVAIAGAVARLVAVALSWAAATVGLGAVVKSRAGIVRFRFETTTSEVAVPAWQTPTPVQGVVAARRPVPTPPHEHPSVKSTEV